MESRLSATQRERFVRLILSSYAFRGMYQEQVEIGEKELEKTTDLNQRAALLYYLTDGYANLGEYEKALQSMNSNIMLLPKIENIRARTQVLQAAVTLMNSLYAYDEARDYAERLRAISPDKPALPSCVGLTDLVEIAFLRKDKSRARSLMPVAMETCNVAGMNVITHDVQILSLVDRLADVGDTRALPESLTLLDEIVKADERSDYLIELADAIARRYLALNQFSKAEQYGVQALEMAESGRAILLRREANETMAVIMRAKGKLDSAIDYLKVSNELWAKSVEERSLKDIVYQRMKFQAQDQSNQLNLLNQINHLLTSERDLQEKNKRNLELLFVVTALLLAVVSVWLIRTWRQKNDFRTYSQIDGLTKISNRGHFITCAQHAFKDARGSIAIILFDMDEFKKINDTYSHAAGDWVLRAVGSTISDCLRSQDLFGRLGGEEFAICLPHTSEHDALILAERCRAAIAAIDSKPSGYDFPLSASFGIAVRFQNGHNQFEEILAAADRALYQAKNLGRNRIAQYGEIISHSPLVVQ